MSTRVKCFEVFPTAPDLFLEADEEIIENKWVEADRKFYILVAPRAAMPVGEA